jgi:hypothetical protein
MTHYVIEYYLLLLMNRICINFIKFVIDLYEFHNEYGKLQVQFKWVFNQHAYISNP